MRQWFVQLQQREQLSVMALALALVLYALYMFVWSPLAEQRQQLSHSNQALAESLTRVDAMVSQVQQLRQRGTGGSRNLTALINRSTSQLQLRVSRLQPNSRGEIQVRMESAVFDNVLTWLYQMENGEGLLVREVSITRGGPPGVVNATVRLAQVL